MGYGRLYDGRRRLSIRGIKRVWPTVQRQGWSGWSTKLENLQIQL